MYGMNTNIINLSRLFQMQKVLDARIGKEHGLEGKDLLPKKILALQVELGELANKWRGFKFLIKILMTKVVGRVKCSHKDIQKLAYKLRIEVEE